MKRLLIILALPLLASCTDERGARRALEAQGYRDIQITGYRMWGCSDNDSYHTGFKATGANGTTITGVVCANFFKGSTVRLD